MSDKSQDSFLGVSRSVSGRRWQSRLIDERAALTLSQRLDLPEIVGRVLAARGVGLDEGEQFLNPTIRDLLPDPFHLIDMERTADRLAGAIMAGEQIAVFGDYDVDGAASSALLTRFIEAVGGNVIVYIPDRMREGYGPNAPALLKLREEGAQVVVTVDCGTASYDALDAAADAGLDVIVVDHHVAEPQLPRCYAMVNPNRVDEQSPHGHLAAVGVAFLVIVAVNRTLREAGWYEDRPEPGLLDWLDIVALGTVCDVVPLLGVNRAFVSQGLKVMAQRGNAGLAALADVGRIDGPPTSYHAGYVLGPRVNAGGRVGESSLGTRLLSTADRDEALTIAHRLDELNTERRTIEASVLAEAIEQAERAVERSDAPMLLVSGADWHAGVIGIVASRLVERFNRPTAVVALDAEGIGKGSARSIPAVDLGAAIIAARQSGLLLAGGGHPMAAGFTVEAARLDALAAFLSERLANADPSLGHARPLGVDAALGVGAATIELVETVARVGPFGSANSEPRFVVANVRVVKADVVGEKHVRAILDGGVGEAGNARLKSIAFRSLETPIGQALLMNDGAPLHVAGHLRVDRWQGNERVQLLIDDVAKAG